jgi:hypothetical protein
VEILVVLALGLTTAVVIASWWFNRPRTATVGKSDIAMTIHLMLRGGEDGALMRLIALDRNAEVTLTRVAKSERNGELAIALSSERMDRDRVAKLGIKLMSLGLSVLSQEALSMDGRGRDAFCMTTYLPNDARTCGSIADLALRAAGLIDGDRYRYRFEGALSMSRLRQDAAERTHIASLQAPGEWQARIFRRMSRSMRTTSGGSSRTSSGTPRRKSE